MSGARAFRLNLLAEACESRAGEVQHGKAKMTQIRILGRRAAMPKLKPIYNTANLSLLKGREDWGKVAGEYEKALAIDSDDFQTQVNLEMLKRAQEQQKQEASGQEQSKSGQEQKRIKQFQMKDKGKEGTESPPKDKNPRY